MTKVQELLTFFKIVRDYPHFRYEVTDDVTQCYPYEKPVRINLNRKDLDDFSEVILFDLLHEIGHALKEKPDYARCVREYNATMWAVKHAKKYGIRLPGWRKEQFQKDIFYWMRMEKSISKLSWYPAMKFRPKEELVINWEGI